MQPILKQQEIPYDDEASCNMFEPSAEKPFVATPDAIREYGQETLIACLRILQEQARIHQGIDYLQIFTSPEPGKPALWFLEDGDGGAITAMTPSDY